MEASAAAAAVPSDVGQPGAGTAAAVISLAGWRIETLLDGTFALDGGAMFGVVPRQLWQRVCPPDETNRIPLASRLLLLRGHGHVVLVDTGLGERWDGKLRDIYRIERPSGLLAGLQQRGIDPADVTDVVLTHLHFDHAGGTTRRVDGRLQLTFPGARHWLQRRHWQWAHAPTAKDTASFRVEDFGLLRSDAELRLLDGEREILPAVRVVPLDGHTTAMQAVLIEGDDGGLLYVADLVPTVAHLRLPWIMAYDNQPLVTLAEKQRLLQKAARSSWLIVFEHDADVVAARLEMMNDAAVIAAQVRF